MTKYRDALKARIAAATKGPLFEREDDDYYQGGTYIGTGGYRYGQRADGTFGQVEVDCAKERAEYFHTDVARIENEADKELLKNAEHDLRLLLAQLERAEAAIAEHKRMWGTGHPETADIRLYDALASLRAVLDAEEK